jgi:hypothetical protein
LVYGALDPAELPLPGLGTVSENDTAQLRALFPRCTPYLFAMTRLPPPAGCRMFSCRGQ